MKKIIAWVLSILFCTHVYASQIQQIVFLGDSLTDNGNLYAALKIIPKSPPYFNGRFSNGPTWAEDLSKFYYDKLYIDAENYAVGGATAIVHDPLDDSFVSPVTLTDQLYDYLGQSLFNDKSTVLYSIWIGANDYLYENSTDIDSLTTNVVASISWSINKLIDNGAKYFLIMNLPDLSRTPYAQQNHVENKLHAVSVLHNQKLADTLKQIQNAHPDIKFVSIDIYSIFNDVLLNTNKYNQLYHQHINNITDACWQGDFTKKRNDITELNKALTNAQTKNKLTLAKNFTTANASRLILNTPSLAEAYATNKLYEQGVMPCPDANSHIFWDHIHPTEAVHEVLAQIIEQELGPL